MAITIATLKEADGENRVALSPDVVARLTKKDFEVLIEKGSGVAAFFPDQAYIDAGAKIVDRDTAIKDAKIVAVVNRPDEAVLTKLTSGQLIIGLLSALVQPDKIQLLAENKVTALSLELLPRTVSRAQSMDALSSQASVAGYKAALVGADNFKRYLPMMITAAGTAKPAKVLVLGTGVAGLQAIGTSKRLGAIVSGYDVRPDSRGEVESLGANFLTSSVSAAGEGGYARQLSAEEQQQQQDELTEFIRQSDIIITTAQVPGRKPPLLVTETAVNAVKPGTIFVDLAASALGGNVFGSEPSQTIITEGNAQIIGAQDMPSQLATAASEMYAKNIQAIITDIVHEDGITIDPDDDVLGELTATFEGEIISNRLRQTLELPARPKPAAEEAAENKEA
ncbi:NAD(P) transhydrogenase subunit alpha [Agrilactobacillus yilanensis]|uniref:proton-translocating NAD(P)(+) transhydrogenase n=1 Tax=Agrilactobacillus yilanensis TaxID=2485997 RepID=A0ABW4J4A6_9LACO|nr:NAD(P) transhydrogenase subunit alpha [Agrilactobacillus yilanensis]